MAIIYKFKSLSHSSSNMGSVSIVYNIAKSTGIFHAYKNTILVCMYNSK